jgi:hypothetical protein
MDIRNGSMHCCFFKFGNLKQKLRVKKMREIFFLAYSTHRVEHRRGPPTWQPGMGVHSRTFTGTKLPRACVIGRAQTLRNGFRRLFKKGAFIVDIWVIIVTTVLMYRWFWKMWYIIFLRANYIMGHFQGIFRMGPRLFWPLNCSVCSEGQFRGQKGGMNNLGRLCKAAGHKFFR